MKEKGEFAPDFSLWVDIASSAEDGLLSLLLPMSDDRMPVMKMGG